MNLKKTVYVAAVIFLCLLLALIAHGLIEKFYIDWFLDRGLVPPAGELGYRCFLPLPAQILLLAAAIIGGWFLGQTWWRIIYVERRWAKRRFNPFSRKHNPQ